MKVGLLQEGDISGGITPAQRYREMIQEVILADRVGFSAWGTSEQHFSPPRFSVSAPEVLYAAIAAQTEQIKLRVMASVLLAWNHPILVAERISTLDIVSDGRAEICTARSNNMHTLGAFGVDPRTTKAQWAEGMEVLVKILSTGEIEHDGEFWQIPHRQVVPTPVQQPHMPISVAASSVGSHADAGRRGIGVIGFENYFGWDYLQQMVDAYREGLQAGTNMAPGRNEEVGLFVSTAFCAETREEAQEVARDVALGYFKFIGDLYKPLASQEGYEYLDEVNRIVANEGDLDFLLTETPSVMIGTPDDFVARLRELEERGVDEVVMRIDGVGHENHMRSIELIGREVIPAVDASRAAVGA
jgi:alkanesulfonate monooxygenase SsuD/methylene tetrahydromethanopterin reductase-like flavin-dependent oxidoreductase (luciferase family)